MREELWAASPETQECPRHPEPNECACPRPRMLQRWPTRTRRVVIRVRGRSWVHGKEKVYGSIP